MRTQAHLPSLYCALHLELREARTCLLDVVPEPGHEVDRARLYSPARRGFERRRARAFLPRSGCGRSRVACAPSAQGSPSASGTGSRSDVSYRGPPRTPARDSE